MNPGVLMLANMPKTKPLPLTDRILMRIGENPRETSREIATALDADYGWVSGILPRLHRRGWVRRGGQEVKCSSPGPWRYAMNRYTLEGAGMTVQEPSDRAPAREPMPLSFAEEPS